MQHSPSSSFASKQVFGEVFHQRFTPVEHGFRYPVRYLLLDLDELSELDSKVTGFGHNRFSLHSVWDRDYLGRDETPLFEKVKRKVEERFPGKTVDRVMLVTAPRYLGYVFNPVSFFWCYDEVGEFTAFVSDINNTYGDGHTYFVDPKESKKKGFAFTDRQKKTFHVSPFFDRSGDYEFFFEDVLEAFAVRISIRRGTGRDFVGETFGATREITKNSLLVSFLKNPLEGVLTMPRILWQAARLHYQRRLAVFRRPIPDVPDTHTWRDATWFEWICMKAIFSVLRGIRGGLLEFHLPDGTRVSLGEAEDQEDKPVVVKVFHYRIFPRLLFATEVAAGETFVDGDWETEDLPRMLTLFAQNKDKMNLRKLKIGSFARFIDRISHLFRGNTKAGSKKNISAHYDLSNDMFRLFLDKSMTYSCAIFDGEKTSLEQAQEKKLAEVLRLGSIEQGEEILEIGCGWGSFAVKAAKEFGCKVTCLTLSEEQAEYARERVKAEGLEELIDIRIEDYRDIQGQYDKIVSIEMIEAVGEEYLPAYFKACERLLKPGGRVIIQAITLKHERMNLYRRSCDWIQKHIFPGCFVPSLEILQDKVSQGTSLEWTTQQAIGPHYAKTLSLWGHRFMEQAREIENLGFPKEFIRKWMYYFGYCEAGFSTGELNTYQFVLEKPHN